MMQHQKVRPKKFLGQHFLHDENTARKITEALLLNQTKTKVLEIGPGMGVLTKYLLQNEMVDLTVVEIDRESVAFLQQHFSALADKIINKDFLELDNDFIFPTKTDVIGNFPYNISSQIFFKILENRNKVNQIVCMLQKEVADRIAAKHGNKTYGILSVLLQTFYTVEMVLKVPPGVFTPPPKVMSAVIRLTRNDRQTLPCKEDLFFKVVKTGFNQRRKTLRNALKNLSLATELNILPVLDKRAEQLSVEDFITLTTLIERSRAGDDGI